MADLSLDNISDALKMEIASGIFIKGDKGDKGTDGTTFEKIADLPGYPADKLIELDSNGNYPSDVSDEDFVKALVKKLVSEHKDLAGKVLIGSIETNNVNLMGLLYAYSLDDHNNTGFPALCCGISLEPGKGPALFGTVLGNWYYQSLS